MGMNIKNEATQRLIRKLAAMTGEGQTEAVTAAVRERIERLEFEKKKQSRIERMMAIADEMAPRLRGMPDHGEYLYDEETGLPK